MAIGEAVPMLDSVARVTGSLDYLVNLKLPGMLVGKFVRSSVPHGRLVRVVVDRAARLPGVVAILTGAELTGRPAYGVGIKDQPLLAFERVRFIGEPVALIAARELSAAEEAARLIEIEYEELPAVFSALEAIQDGAPAVHEARRSNIFKHAKLRHGDIETAFAQADEIFENTFTSPAAQQASLEPHVAAAQWDGTRLTVWSATQAPYMVQKVLAETFGLEADQVRVIASQLGGGYGGKGHVRIEPQVAALAFKTHGKPVKVTLTREEEFVTVTKHAATLRLKTGVRRDGRFAARQVTIHWNGGAYADASAFLVSGGMVRSIGPYRIPAVRVDSYGIYTNLPPAAAYRGAMSSQATWAYESQMDIIAKKMGWDPLEFRMNNLLRTGDTFATGEKMQDVHFTDCLQAVAEGLDWGSVKRAVQTGTLRRGRGLAVMMKSSAGRSKSRCRVKINVHGEVTLFTSSVEMGQGIHTALSQICAASLSLPLSQIKLVGPDTDQTPFDSTTSASRSTSMMGNAVVDATEKLIYQLINLAAPILEVDPDKLTVKHGTVCSQESGEAIPYPDILIRNQLDSLEASGEYETRLGLDPETGQGVATPHWHQGAGAAEVAVDTETGQVRLLRYQAASYAGQVVNPSLAQLQNDGNVIFGLGPALMEEIIFDGGQVTNPNLSDYLIPSFRDIPLSLQSVCIEMEGSEIHGIGEMTLPPVAPAIANAIADAVGVRIVDLPISAEKVLRALREQVRG